MAGMHKAAVCICTRNRPDELARTLASIAASSVPVAQVIVSDDGDSVRAVCDQSPVTVDYLEGPHQGLAANRNRALRALRAPYVLFLDDDCLIGREFIEQAMARMQEAEREAGPGRAIVSGSELNQGRVVVAHDQTFLGFQARAYRPGECIRSIVINATVFPARLFDEVRFDSRLVYGYEEVDLASRAVAVGYQITMCPEAQNEHRPSAKSRDDYATYRDASRLYATFKRYRDTERSRTLALAYTLVAPAHVLVAGAKRRRLRAAVQSVRLAAGYRRQLRRAVTPNVRPW
jgi:GT2 family glycosyltransferase